MIKMKKMSKMKFISAILAGGFALTTMTGCTVKEEPKEREVVISNLTTASETMDVISDAIGLDDKINESTSENSKLEELDAAYLECRKSDDLNKCCSILGQMGELLLKAKVAEYLNIAIDDIDELSYSVDDDYLNATISVGYTEKVEKVVPGGITTTSSSKEHVYIYTKEPSYRTIFDDYNESELKKLVINTRRTTRGHLSSLDELDAIYLAYQRTMLYNLKTHDIQPIFVMSELNEKAADEYESHVKTLKK